jgi:hypothetical protein
LVVFGPLVQKLWRSIDFSFKLENAFSPENYPIFGGLYPEDESFSDIFVHQTGLFEPSTMMIGLSVWAVREPGKKN